MNVKEFKEWLEQFDEDATVEIVIHSRGFGYYDQGGNATTTEFRPESFEVGDNKYCRKDHFEYQSGAGGTLLLGAHNS